MDTRYTLYSAKIGGRTRNPMDILDEHDWLTSYPLENLIRYYRYMAYREHQPTKKKSKPNNGKL